ncbi:MAG: hypothetical protein JWQ18_525, partial [Conexibacter sp.]|nr:hypothetical protein [Conexibacter sp.]
MAELLERAGAALEVEQAVGGARRDGRGGVVLVLGAPASGRSAVL